MPTTVDYNLPIGNTFVPLRLYAEGAIGWPDGQTLFVSDPHFGKADSFRHAGIAIPTAVLDRDLERLTTLLGQSQARVLIFLGDFFHTRHSQSENALASLELWRDHHRDVKVVLVQGNHDLHAGAPPAAFDIQSVEAPLLFGPFACYHHPQRGPSEEGYILSGHLHPYVVLRDRDRSTLRLATFIFGPYQAILPAFGAFTGGSHYAPTPKDRVFAIAKGEIVEIPTVPPRAIAPPPPPFPMR